jgi:hypothetical protein
MKYPLLDEIGAHFMDSAVELLKKGNQFVFVLDNIDWTVKVHEMRSDHQNQDVHAVATSLVFDRVPSTPSTTYFNERESLDRSDVRTIVTPDRHEIICTRERYKFHIPFILNSCLAYIRCIHKYIKGTVQPFE